MTSTSKSSFFRQSGWMVIATFLGGIFMAGVQFLAQKDGVLENTDCNNFVALLTLLIVIGGVPSAALQTIFAQQAAAAVTPEKNAELSATTRALLRTTFLFWFVMAGLVMIFLGPVSAVLGVNDRAALRIAMMAALSALWLPTFKGVLQGMHRFASLGWLLIVEGAARLATFILLVILLKGRAAGGLWAVFAAQYLTLGIAVWLTRDVWGAKTSAAFSWRAWLIRGAPLTLGMGALIFISRLDNLFTKSLFFNSNDVKVYNCAMFIGFAITQFIAPITNVMFPTIVRNLALSRKTDALFLTLAVTGAFACLAALGCTLFPRLPVAILFPKQMGAAALVPWFLLNYDLGEPVNISSGVRTPIAELAGTIKKATGFEGRITWDTSKPDGQMDKIFDVTRLHKLGLSCPTTLEEGLRKTVRWFLEARAKGEVRL